MVRNVALASLLALSLGAVPAVASSLWPDLGGRPTLRLETEELKTGADVARLEQRLERLAARACEPVPAALGINQPGAGAPRLEEATAECVEATRDGARLIPDSGSAELMSAQ
jgi:UrcA family protein